LLTPTSVLNRQGKLANVVPGAMKSAMHEKMAKPLEEEKAAR
jgi:hypothetical protein